VYQSVLTFALALLCFGAATGGCGGDGSDARGAKGAGDGSSDGGAASGSGGTSAGTGSASGQGNATGTGAADGAGAAGSGDGSGAASGDGGDGSGAGTAGNCSFMSSNPVCADCLAAKCCLVINKCMDADVLGCLSCIDCFLEGKGEACCDETVGKNGWIEECVAWNCDDEC
jgi:hypothetical protein